MVMIKGTEFIKVTSNNKNQVKKKPERCAVCRLMCACEILAFYDKNRHEKCLVDKKLVCKKCKESWTLEYAKALNTGQLSCGLQLYEDILYGVELLNINFQADCCKHVKDPKVLKKNFANVVNDYEESLKQKRYLPTFETEQEAITVLESQLYPIVDYRQEEGTTKYVVRLPEGRISTTEIEAAAMNRLSTRPVITNVEKKMFLILKDEA